MVVPLAPPFPQDSVARAFVATFIYFVKVGKHGWHPVHLLLRACRNRCKSSPSQRSPLCMSREKVARNRDRHRRTTWSNHATQTRSRAPRTEDVEWHVDWFLDSTETSPLYALDHRICYCYRPSCSHHPRALDSR